MTVETDHYVHIQPYVRGSFVYLAFSLACLILISPLSDADEFNEDHYKNYLHWPRLHFSGLFQADTPTVNNVLRNYYLDDFSAKNLDSLNGYGGWNPNGTGAFRMVRTQVTGLCFAEGLCGAEEELDPIIGAPIEENETSSDPKMITLDPECTSATVIYGLRLRIGNYLKGHVHPSHKSQEWNKENGTEWRVSSRGASFHAFIENITWLEGAPSSPFIRQLREAVLSSGTGRLSLRFHVDQFQLCYQKESFTWGRLVGAIGVFGSRSPLNTLHGRELYPSNIAKAENKTHNAPFVLDLHKKRVHVDFGNSLPVTLNGSHRVAFLGELAVGYSLDESPLPYSCSNTFDFLGLVNYRRHNWYETTAGIQSFPDTYPLSTEQMAKLRTTPLVMAEVEGAWPNITCKEVLLEEANHGILVRPRGEWTHRLDAGMTSHFDLFVTKFGEPLAGAPVQLSHDSATPKDPCFTLPTIPLWTNNQGVVSFSLPTGNPNNPRKVVDGQVYGVRFQVINQTSPDEDFAIWLLLWDKYEIDSAPNWVDHVYPIFKQYANLYPVMKHKIIDLGNFDDVVKKRRLVQMSMLLPSEHPNYMPASRDLSNAKRNMILHWLSQPELLYSGTGRSELRSNTSASKPIFPPFASALKRCIIPAGIHFSLEPSVYHTWKIMSSFKRAKVKSAASRWNLQQLRNDLQTALEIEHATIPPYMTALSSIKEGYNENVAHLLKSVLIQEMLHMSLVANILNAVGGQPSLTHANFVPPYPSALPGGVAPGLVVPLQNLSRTLIKDVFMKIEEPELTIKALRERRSFMKYRENYWHKRGFGPNGTLQLIGDILEHQELLPPGNAMLKNANPERSERKHTKREKKIEIKRRFRAIKRRYKGKKGDMLPCMAQDDHTSWRSTNVIEAHKDTIGSFYVHIAKTLAHLTRCGQDDSIFTGHPSSQLTSEMWYAQNTFGHGKMVRVTDYSSAMRAITEIMEQGEGSSPCTPFATDVDAHDLSHYFSFYSMYKGRMVQHKNWDGTELPRGVSDDVRQWFKICGTIYMFDGEIVNFDPSGMWPIIPNPKLSDYVPWSRPYMEVLTFKNRYARLLGTLEKAFNGHPEIVKDAMGLMLSLGVSAKRIVQMPLKYGVDGPNAAPVYHSA